MMLDDKMRLELALLARSEDRSVSDLAREMLWEKIEEKKKAMKRTKKISAAEAMRNMANEAEKLAKFDQGPADLSENYDKYIY